MNLSLSIIVPVYNVERYLVRCIDSLLNQDITPSEYEIILIDDGSPDNCGHICESYASLHSNIQVVHQTNAGLSASRNNGVSLAKGEFILFVDSDDFLCPNVLGKLIDQIRRDNLVALRFDYENVNEKDEIIHPNKNPKLYSDYSDSPTTGLDFLLNRLGFACYAWQFIIPKQLAAKVTFTEKMHYEDTEWLIRLLPSITRIASSKHIAYCYRVREGSITKSKSLSSIEKNLKDQLTIISILKDRKAVADSPSWFDAMISITVISILQLVAKKLYPIRKQIVREIKQARVFPLTSYRQTKQSRRKIHIINLSPRLFCLIYRFLP